MLPRAVARPSAALAREHFRWLGRSLLERGLLWYASPARLRRLIQVEGDVHLAERSEKPVMWLAPHFMALDVAGASVLLFQKRKGISIYQRQSDPVLDAALRRGRLRLGNAEIFSRDEAGKALMRAIRRGDGFFNLPAHTREFLEAQIAILMGGRIAEELFLRQMTSGAGNDIERATDIARRMVCEFGMSAALGPLAYRTPGNPWETDKGAGISEATAQRVDEEVRELVMRGYETARQIVGARRGVGARDGRGAARGRVARRGRHQGRHRGQRRTRGVGSHPRRQDVRRTIASAAGDSGHVGCGVAT